jgi:proteasome activator subunit 3 (PA28 gamma)
VQVQEGAIPILLASVVFIASEEVLSELHRAQESAFNVRDTARQDHIARGKICSKMVKYPNIQDYPVRLHEMDRSDVD